MNKKLEKRTLYYEQMIREFIEKSKNEKGENLFSFKFIDSSDDIWKNPMEINSGFRATNGLRKWSVWGRYNFLFFLKPSNGKEVFVKQEDFFGAFECEGLNYNESSSGLYRLQELSEDLKELEKSAVDKRYHLRFAVNVLYIILYSYDEKTAIALSLEQLEEIKSNFIPVVEKVDNKPHDIDWEGYIEDDYSFLRSISENPHNQ